MKIGSYYSLTSEETKRQEQSGAELDATLENFNKKKKKVFQRNLIYKSSVYKKI